MRLNSYLTFKGNCEEAMNLYMSVLNANVTSFVRFEEAPEKMCVPDEAKQLVMHATLEFQGNALMMSDRIDDDFIQGNTISLSINAEEDEASTIFNKLLEEGNVIMPFDDAFWGGKFGMLVDEYGVQWMVTSNHKPL